MLEIARILKDNEGCRINILGCVSYLRLSLSLSLFLRSFLLFCSCSFRVPRDDTKLQPAAARAPDCNRNSFVNYWILRPRATFAAPSTALNVGFAREHTLRTVVTIVHQYCPLMPGRSQTVVSCRTYSLTLDTVPSIQRHFSETPPRSRAMNRYVLSCLEVVLEAYITSTLTGFAHIMTSVIFAFMEEFQEGLISCLLSEAVTIVH